MTLNIMPVRANRLNEMAAPNALLDLNGQRVTNAAAPLADGDLVTRAYADGLRAGLLFKAEAVRVGGGTPSISLGPSNTMGFFGGGPVARPATPATLGEVIAALVNLGLVG